MKLPESPFSRDLRALGFKRADVKALSRISDIDHNAAATYLVSQGRVTGKDIESLRSSLRNDVEPIPFLSREEAADIVLRSHFATLEHARNLRDRAETQEISQ